MFRYLGTFVVLAVCFFAIAIVMVGCGDDDKPPMTLPPMEETEEETFKEQLVEGSWRVVSWEGESLGAMTEFQNSLRFANSGEITWRWDTSFSNSDLGEIKFLMTRKGSYFVSEDSGSSAIMSLSFTESVVQVQGRGENFEAEGHQFGDIAGNTRASINGDQLCIGDSLFERN